MKLSYFFMLGACATASCVYAQQPLPPVLDNSTYRGALYETAQPGMPQPSSMPSVSAQGGDYAVQTNPPTMPQAPSLPAQQGGNVPTLPTWQTTGMPVQQGGSSPTFSTQPVDTSRLQAEVNQLKKKVEEQSHTISHLKQRQDSLNAQLNQRLTNVSAGVNGTQQPKFPKVGVGFGYEEIAATPAPTPAPIYTISPIPSTNQKARYQNAYNLFKKGNLDQALSEFQDIIATFPTGEYADNSQYWIGETLLKKGDKAAALQAFDNVIRNYPSSAKVPDALLKLGITELSLKNRGKAKEYFDFLISKYPGTPSANTAMGRKSQAGL